MTRFLSILLILLAFSPTALAKSGKTSKSGGHPAYQRTLIFDANSTKSRAQVLLATDALKDVAIKAPLLTLEKKKEAVAGEEDTEAETTAVKETTIKIAPAKTKSP